MLISTAALAHANPARYFGNGCPKDSSQLLPHQDCGRFYICFGETKLVRECPSGLHFNAELELCDLPQNVKCNMNKLKRHLKFKVEEILQRKNENPSALCASKNSEGILIPHEKCNQFYKCSAGRPVEFSCPTNLLFNEINQMCDWPEKVDCDNRLIMADDTGSENNNDKNDDSVVVGGDKHDPSQAPVICASENSDGVLVAHEECNRFYKCFDGHPVALNCPNKLVYNPEMEYCDWPWNVNCGQREIFEDNDVVDNNGDNNQVGSGNVGNNADPSEAPKICAEENSDGILVAHENCDQFYKCLGGKPLALNCPDNLFYNPEQGYCDWQYNVKCNNKVIPEENNDSIGNNFANQVCSGRNDDIMLPHENCNQFYKCVHNHKQPMYCPPGLHFNTILNVCDWPFNVDCGQRNK